MRRSTRTVESTFGRPWRLRLAKWLIVREANRQFRIRRDDVLIDIGHHIRAEFQ